MTEPLPVWSGGSLSIGDAERDQAVASLGDHFVAGRLTQDEFEERSERATKARYDDEVALLFADLPELTRQGLISRPQRRRPGPPPPLMMLLPLLTVGLVVSAVLLTAPWILWMLFWVALFSGARRHKHWHQGHGHHGHGRWAPGHGQGPSRG